MCFYHGDADWYASINEETRPVADRELRCDECGEPIAAGETYVHIYQQEHEECQSCIEQICDCVNWEDDDADDAHACRCESPELGETFRYNCCIKCDQFLHAVAVAEKEEGCEGDETKPSLMGMCYEIQELGEDGAAKYFLRARELFPELEASGHLRRLCGRMNFLPDLVGLGSS